MRWGLWAVSCAAACSAPSAAPEVTTLDVATAALTSSSTVAPSVSASTAPSVVSVAAPTELPVRSATPGKIQCETVDCDLATELCCLDESSGKGRCVPTNTPDAAACGPGEQVRACDEGGDCGASGHCCRSQRRDGDCASTEVWGCEASCGASAEPTNELCLTGSSCARGACQASKDIAGWPRQGACPTDGPPIACGATTCAPGEGCCWSSKTKKGRCVKSGEDCSPDYEKNQPAHLFRCRSYADCSGDQECFSSTGNMFSHEFSCGTVRCNPMIGIIGPYLCQTKKDCTPSITVIASETTDATYNLTGCGQDPDYPPGIKVCKYK